MVCSRSATNALASSGWPQRRHGNTPSRSSAARLYTSTPTLAGRWMTWKNLPKGMNTSVSTTVAMWAMARKS
jgi:hypothetical protein